MTNEAKHKAVQQAFEEQFGVPPKILVRAPGRVNLIGEHTDYNEGFVFPVAIDREMIIAASPNESSEIVAYSLAFDETDRFITLDIGKSDSHNWANYLRGVISTLQKHDHKIMGFNAVLSGDVPQGAGLSSSAAYEVAVATFCNFAQKLNLSGKEIALLAQQAENEFVGMQCGIMDQFISALGHEDSALLIDCRSLDYRVVPLNLLQSDCAIVITNSGVQRGLVDSEYNTRRQQCAEGVNMLERLMGRALNSLRDVELEEFETHVKQLPLETAQRCRHVISENKRVVDAVAALEMSDLKSFGRLMNESHQSLRDDFAVSCPEVDTLVELSQKHPGVLGARMTGAGFGGCTVAIMKRDAIDSFKSNVVVEYEKSCAKKAEAYVCEASPGAQAWTLTFVGTNLL